MVTSCVSFRFDLKRILWSNVSQNLSIYQTHLKGFLKHRGLGLNPRVSDLPGLGWGPRFCMLISQVMLVQLVRGPYFEKHSSRERGKGQL